MKNLSKEEIIEILRSLNDGEITVSQAYTQLCGEEESEGGAETNDAPPPTGGGPKPGGGNP